MKTKKQRFREIFEGFVNDGAKYVGVYVKAPNVPEPELILNPVVNAKEKLKYYMKAYNDDMQLNTVSSIKVLAVTGAIYLEDVEDNAVFL